MRTGRGPDESDLIGSAAWTGKVSSGVNVSNVMREARK